MKREIKLGILTIVTIALAIWGYQFIKGKNIFGNSISLITKFSEVNELEVASPVMVNGFKVGSVLDIEIDPKNVDYLIVSFDLEGDIRLPKNTKAILKSTNVLGGRFIELEFDNMCADQCLEDGDELQSEVRSLIGSMVSEDEIDLYVSKLGGGMDTVFSKLSKADPNTPIGSTMINLEETMENMNELTKRINGLISSTSTNLSGTLENLNHISSNLASNNVMINELLSNFNKVSEELGSIELKSTIEKSNSTIDNTNEAIDDLKGLLSETKTTVDGATTLMNKLNSEDGSVGKLLTEKELYDNLNNSTRNLDLLLQDIRLHPKRYIKLSVFGKKERAYEYPDGDPANDRK